MSIYLLSPTQKEGTISLPMIRFDIHDDVQMNLTQVDLLMFTSVQGVRSVEELGIRWKEIPSIAVGAATEKMITSLGGKITYRAKKFYVKELAKEITSKFKEKKILYIRPKVVSFDVKTYLAKEGMEIQEAIVYETSCNTYDVVQKPTKGAVIIFTSPSTIDCFFKNFTWDESYTAVVIGKSTKKHLPTHIEPHMAKKPSIESCIEKAKGILTPNKL